MDGLVIIEVEDLVDGECKDEIIIIFLSSCFEECSIIVRLLNIICNDGGILYDLSDDIYFVVV